MESNLVHRCYQPDRWLAVSVPEEFSIYGSHEVVQTINWTFGVDIYKISAQDLWTCYGTLSSSLEFLSFIVMCLPRSSANWQAKVDNVFWCKWNIKVIWKVSQAFFCILLYPQLQNIIGSTCVTVYLIFSSSQ